MTVHLVNPSDVSFGIGVITPRWLYVLAAATPREHGDPLLTDETLEPLDLSTIRAGDVVGIGIHTGNALRGYQVGRMARERGASVVFGGIHAGLYPEEAREFGGAHAVVRGDGDVVWGKVVADCLNGGPAPVYDAGQVDGCDMLPARWDLLPPNRYMWASVQTVRGCPKHCSFCSVWRTDGQAPRQRSPESIMREAVELRRMGFRYLALSDDNFYPVSLGDLEMARRREDKTRLHELERLRAERVELMRRLAQLPSDTVMFTQITMEAAEDKEFLKGMHDARIRGALVGVESIGEEGLKSIYKGFNQTGESLVRSLQAFREAGVHVLGSFIFGLPSDTAGAWDATVALAQQASVTFAQFVILTPFPGTLDFARWEAAFNGSPDMVDGVPVTRHWLLPKHRRPKIFSPTRRCRAKRSGPAPRGRGTSSTACPWSGSGRAVSRRCVRGWPSC